MTNQARLALFFIFAGASVLLFMFVVLFGLDNDKASAQRANQCLEYGGIASAVLAAGVIAGAGNKPDRQAQYPAPQYQPGVAAPPYPPQQQTGPQPYPQYQPQPSQQSQSQQQPPQ